MELIEKLQKIMEREIDNVPMVLTDPLTLRRLRAERLAQAALTALIEHAGQDGVTEALRVENARLREALGLIIENESADTGYGNSSAKIAHAALGDWKSGAGDLGGDHVR